MFYEMEVEDYVRVDPIYLKYPKEKAVLESLKSAYSGKISKKIGIVIGVTDVLDIGEGVMIPEDGAVYYPVRFKIITYKPELNEIVNGIVTNITEFGAFVTIGAMDGFIHISQVMDDYVSYSKEGILTGKESKRVLKVGDKVRARIISISFKDPNNPKIAMTMRQPGLGKWEWLEEEKKKSKKKKK